MRLAISTTETLADLTMDLVVANNNSAFSYISDILELVISTFIIFIIDHKPNWIQHGNNKIAGGVGIIYKAIIFKTKPV